MVRFDRYESLHKPNYVATAMLIKELALAEEKKTGEATLYMTAWDIASTLGVEVQTVRFALRLSYTAKFQDTYGYGFIAPGSGRSGELHGYTLQHPKAMKGNNARQERVMDYQDRWVYDHLSGLAGHYSAQAIALGPTTKRGRAAAHCAAAVQVAATSVGLLL